MNNLDSHSERQHKAYRGAPRKRPLAELLVERGIFESVDEARRWIMSGQVIVNEQRFDKPGMLVSQDVHVRVRGRSRYVSRGGYKLEAALEYFGIDVHDRVALDCGASTGGFTDCLLQYGAALVYAVDAGFGQLAGRLRADARVRNLERTNLSDLLSSGLEPTPTIITLDLSYLSLTQALPIAESLLAAQGDVLALVKPLFEVESAEARRSGRIDEPEQLIEPLRSVLSAGRAAGLNPLGLAKLALRPRHGVNEFMVFLSKRTSLPPHHYDDIELHMIITQPGIGRQEE